VNMAKDICSRDRCPWLTSNAYWKTTPAGRTSCREPECPPQNQTEILPISDWPN